MKTIQLFSRLAPAVSAIALAACMGPVDSEPSAHTGAAQAAPASQTAIQIEEAERMLDRSQDAARAKALLQSALDSDDITPDERRQALLALSRAHAELGEREEAIAILEQEIAAHADSRDWPGEAFGKQLRLLLEGERSFPAMNMPERSTVAPFAHVLVPYFPPSADGTYSVQYFLIGHDDAVGDELGTFNLSGALREKRERECPLCEQDIHVNMHTRGSASGWLLIPENQHRFHEGLTVFYFDLYENRIPARYERHLPMKVADIERELEAGKSFVVARERPGSPPSILLAAPRRAMLPEVEAKLASLTELPTEPVFVDLDPKLRPAEIQGAVRAQWMPEIRRCYEKLLESSPDAAGSIEARFVIEPEGNPSSIALSMASALEPTRACLTSALEKVRFPASDTSVTVTYPVVVNPD